MTKAQRQINGQAKRDITRKLTQLDKDLDHAINVSTSDDCPIVAALFARIDRLTVARASIA